jgi:hypothetical protein
MPKDSKRSFFYTAISSHLVERYLFNLEWCILIAKDIVAIKAMGNI